MAQREARLSRTIIAALKQRFGFDVFCFKVWGSEHQFAGLPDILGCLRGRFFGLEVKLPESRSNVSPRQQLVHEFIANAGGLAVVVCSPTEAIAALEKLLIDP